MTVNKGKSASVRLEIHNYNVWDMEQVMMANDDGWWLSQDPSHY